jgi:hypothetical protein
MLEPACLLQDITDFFNLPTANRIGLFITPIPSRNKVARIFARHASNPLPGMPTAPRTLVRPYRSVSRWKNRRSKKCNRATPLGSCGPPTLRHSCLIWSMFHEKRLAPFAWRSHLTFCQSLPRPSQKVNAQARSVPRQRVGRYQPAFALWKKLLTSFEVPVSTNPIQHVFVLMLENRSFDHMLGFSGISGIDAETY